jgi:hypothetical protein
MERGSDLVKLLGNAISEPERKLALEEENGRLRLCDMPEACRQGTQAVVKEAIILSKK